MTVQLRPHHLLCFLTYVGKGYSAEFIENYDRIAARLSDGEDIEIVSGPDDICALLLDDVDAHCWRESITIRDEAAAAALSEKFQTPIDIGVTLSLTPSTLRRMRVSFGTGSIRQACIRCEWYNLCTDVAASNYEKAKVNR